MSADEKAKKIILELLYEVKDGKTTPEGALVIMEKLIEDDADGFEIK